MAGLSILPSLVVGRSSSARAADQPIVVVGVVGVGRLRVVGPGVVGVGRLELGVVGVGVGVGVNGTVGLDDPGGIGGGTEGTLGAPANWKGTLTALSTITL